MMSQIRNEEQLRFEKLKRNYEFSKISKRGHSYQYLDNELYRKLIKQGYEFEEKEYSEDYTPKKQVEFYRASGFYSRIIAQSTGSRRTIYHVIYRKKG